MPRVTMLLTEAEGQRVLGTFTLRGGRVEVEAPTPDGLRVLNGILAEPLVARYDRSLSAAGDPEAWIRELPFAYNGSRLRARLDE